MAAFWCHKTSHDILSTISLIHTASQGTSKNLFSKRDVQGNLPQGYKGGGEKCLPSLVEERPLIITWCSIRTHTDLTN